MKPNGSQRGVKDTKTWSQKVAIMKKTFAKLPLRNRNGTVWKKDVKRMTMYAKHGAKFDAQSHYKSMNKQVTEQLTKIMQNEDKMMPKWNQKS